MTELDPMTSEEAQEIHDLSCVADPEHDLSSCWCCCMDCDTDAMWVAVRTWELQHGTKQEQDAAHEWFEQRKGSRGE